MLSALLGVWSPVILLAKHERWLKMIGFRIFWIDSLKWVLTWLLSLSIKDTHSFTYFL